MVRGDAGSGIVFSMTVVLMKPPALPLVLEGNWYRANVVQTELLAGIVEGAGFVTRAIIGHGADVGNTKAAAIRDCGLGKAVKFITFFSGKIS